MSKTSGRSSRRRDSAAVADVDIATFPNAIRYLFNRADVERMRAVSVNRDSFKLNRTRKLLAALDHPEDLIRTAHIAGTVGKGSTLAMLGSMLRACGYAVGMYTSPHLVDVRERVQINGQMISRNEFTNQMKEVAKAAASLPFEPTFFELITALAFKHFAEQAVDIALIETGLGGRLDCTNVITPEVSLITRIDSDHAHLLGRTLPEIAREKAGILKPGVPAISVEQPDEVEAVLKEVAAKVGTTLEIVNRDIEFSYRFGGSRTGLPQSQVCLFTDASRFEHVPVPLQGEHQAFNCGLALAAVDALKGAGYDLPDTKVHEGLASTQLPGRMELIWPQPRIIADGAHNAASIGALVKSIGAHVPYDSLVVVFGCCEDKDVPAMLRQLERGADKVIFTRMKGIPRAADPDDLRQEFNSFSGKMCQVAPNVADALNLASRAVGREDLICVTGSFYLVGETKKYLADVEKKRRTAAAAR